MARFIWKSRRNKGREKRRFFCQSNLCFSCLGRKSPLRRPESRLLCRPRTRTHASALYITALLLHAAWGTSCQFLLITRYLGDAKRATLLKANNEIPCARLSNELGSIFQLTNCTNVQTSRTAHKPTWWNCWILFACQDLSTKYFKTLWGFQAKHLEHTLHSLQPLLIGLYIYPTPGLAGLCLSPFHHPLVSLMLRCLSPVKAWRGPDRLPLKGPSVIFDIRYQ